MVCLGFEEDCSPPLLCLFLVAPEFFTEAIILGHHTINQYAPNAFPDGGGFLRRACYSLSVLFVGEKALNSNANGVHFYWLRI